MPIVVRANKVIRLIDSPPKLLALYLKNLKIVLEKSCLSTLSLNVILSFRKNAQTMLVSIPTKADIM